MGFVTGTLIGPSTPDRPAPEFCGLSAPVPGVSGWAHRHQRGNQQTYSLGSRASKAHCVDPTMSLVREEAAAL